MNDAFDKDVAKRMPKTKPRHPWDIKPSENVDTESIDISSIDKKSTDEKFVEKSTLTDVPDFNYIDEHILPTLDPKAQLVYIRLYRLSYGSQRDTTDFIGYTSLARQCSMSAKSVYRAIKDLLDRRLIFITEHHRSKGTKYRIAILTMDNTSIDK